MPRKKNEMPGGVSSDKDLEIKEPEKIVSVKEDIEYSPGKYVCRVKCFTGTKFYNVGDLREVKEYTFDTSLKHFDPVKNKKSGILA